MQNDSENVTEKDENRQIDTELEILGKVSARTMQLSQDFEKKLSRVMMHPYVKEEQDECKYDEICSIASSIRQFKDQVVLANENFSDILRRIEL